MSSIQFVDALLADAYDQRAERGPSDAEGPRPLQVVSGVAERVIGSVASLRISRRLPGGRQAQGAGSAVAITPDSFLVTSAHVVEGVGKGRASLADGRELRFKVVGRDALSDLAVIRAEWGRPGAGVPGERRPAPGRPARRGRRQPDGAGRLDHRRGGSALGRSFPTSDGRASRLLENVIQTDAAQPRQLRGRPGRRPRPRGWGQHGRRRHRPRPGRAHQRHHPADHRRPDARRPLPAGLHRDCRRGRPHLPVSPRRWTARPGSRSSRWSTAARRTGPGCATRT